jgi:hypothetical protein
MRTAVLKLLQATAVLKLLQATPVASSRAVDSPRAPVQPQVAAAPAAAPQKPAGGAPKVPATRRAKREGLGSKLA